MTQDSEYSHREIMIFLREQQALDRLPLSERKENAAEFAAAMRTEPALVAERVGWLLNGSYGQGAYIKSRQVAASPRMNRAAALTMMIGGAEWRVPGRMVAAAWHTLTPAQKKKLDTFLQKEIRDWEKDQKTEASRDRGRPRRAPTRRRAAKKRSRR